MKLINDDCMNILPKYEDNYFDLAIVDPPYGLGDKLKQGGNTGVVTFKDLYNGFDDAIPDKKYFDELFRVSKNQIIWGGNYFLDYLGCTRCVLIWDKKDYNSDFADGELAWTSFNKNLKIFKRARSRNNDNKNKIHPTQKPVALYEWILMNYAKEGDTILDTHLGSGSIAIACHNLSYDLTACEIDREYYNDATKRIEQHTSQKRLF